MDSENEIHGATEPEEDLHELLEAAERRKAAEMRRNAKSFRLIVGIPAGILLLWAAIFLITYDQGSQQAANDSDPATPAPTPAQRTTEQQLDAPHDMFRDPKDREVKTNILGLQETSGKLVDKEDIRFTMELMNFMQAPPPAEGKKK